MVIILKLVELRAMALIRLPGFANLTIIDCLKGAIKAKVIP